MRPATTLIASVAMTLAAFGLAVAAPRDPAEAQTWLLAASGPIGIANSREGEAVFGASGMRPGQQVAGTVRIANRGAESGSFSLRADSLAETAGTHGGLLSQQLALTVLDITDPQHPAALYAGTPAALPELALGSFAAGEEREYRIAATLPDTGIPASAVVGDNRFQGARLSFGLVWTAIAAAPMATPVPTTPSAPQPAPVTVPGAQPAPAGTAAPAKPTGDVLGDSLGLPSSRRCVSRSRLELRLHAPHGARVESATVRVGKRRLVVQRPGRRAIVLRRLPRRTFTVRIAVRSSDGRTYRTKRTYRACKRR